MTAMENPLVSLGAPAPVLAAPMAGGASTTALLGAAARAGSLGFLPAGYLTVPALAQRIAEARAQGILFGVNLFAPNPQPVGPEAFRTYAGLIQPEAHRYGLDLTHAEPVEDDDAFAAKADLLLSDPVPVVSFTFGIPDPSLLTALRRAGTLVLQTVTNAAEAKAAVDAGVDGLIVQASAAGGHSGTLTPRAPLPSTPLDALVAQVRNEVGLPILAAGGVATPGQVTQALRAGAQAVMVGTALLRTHESGASAVHKAALADLGHRGTVLTHAFTGRPARALRNRFTDRYTEQAPYGYPALHHLTGALRRHAAQAGDPENLHLWAGTGHSLARAEPAEATLTRLAGDV